VSIADRLITPPKRDAPPTAVLLARIGRQAMRALGEAMEPTRLKPRHVNTLAALRERSLTQAALGEEAGVDAATLVGILNELETEGLASRRRDPADRRRHNVAITDLGRARLAAVDAATAAVAAHFLAGLDEAQKAYLTALLVHIDANANTDATCPETAPSECPTTPTPCD
jgi:DNA-binding MarR family transcriptional regulator